MLSKLNALYPRIREASASEWVRVGFLAILEFEFEFEFDPVAKLARVR